MLIGLAIRDVVLIESLDLAPGPGLTALTGETGAGKSIILDALGMACGARADAALVRNGAAQAAVTAIFAPAPDDAVWAYLEEKAIPFARDEDLVLRRTLSADGRSRAFVNDQAVGVGVLRDLGALLVEVHGQHETVGLLDARTHLALLDRVGGCEPQARTNLEAWSAWRAASERAAGLAALRDRAATEAAELAAQLAELDRLAPKPGEAAALAQERTLLGAAEKILADIAAAREQVDGDALAGRLGGALRALDRARQRVAGLGEGSGAALGRLSAACEALDRALVEAQEASAAIDAAAEAFDLDPARLEQAEERLFALRAAARRLGVEPDELASVRAQLAARLLNLEDSGAAAEAAEAAAAEARQAWRAAAAALTAARQAAADALAGAVAQELVPLKLEKARFRVQIEPLDEARAGPTGADRVEFQIATLPDAPFRGLGAIASGGELSRFALAIKACLARGAAGAQPLMIFDEIDQGVGGAVADAIGLRLRALSAGAQVLVVTHSPQVAARADAHWRVRKDGARAEVDQLAAAAREEEIARMLAGAQVTDAARAAARALMHV